MKIRLTMSLFAVGCAFLAGCASSPMVSDIPVRMGMEGSYVKKLFGEPLRVQADTAGGQVWYYNFVSWKGNPDGGAGTSVSPERIDSHVDGGLSISRETAEEPIHISEDGHVIEPIPPGKIVKNF